MRASLNVLQNHTALVVFVFFFRATFDEEEEEEVSKGLSAQPCTLFCLTVPPVTSAGCSD